MANGQQDQPWTAQSGYTKPARPEWGQASWYQQHIPSQLVKGQANQLGISTDQMYQIYAQQGLGPSAIGQGAGAWSNPNQGSGAGGGGQWIPSTPGVISGVQQAEQAHSIGNILWPQPVQQTPGPPPPAPTGATVMHPLQLPTAPLPVQPTAPPSTQPIFQSPAQVPQQGPASTQPITSNVLNPIPVQVQPVQQYGSGGLVQRFQDGGQVQQLGPGITRNAQGEIIYTDPRLQTQLGLGDLTVAQQTSLGLDPVHSQALSGATQIGAQYAPEFLGAAALNMPAVINLPPSGTPSSKSGVAPTPGAIVGTGVPQTPQGPWLTNPSIFARATPYTPTAAPTVTPQTPATAVPYAPGQAFATPPAQPGYTLGSTPPPTPSIRPMLPAGFGSSPQGMGYVPQGWQQPGAGPPPPAPISAPVALQTGAQGAAPPQAFLQAHTSALANAGMAMYAHFGGDPNSASPADIANFHSQLTNAVGQHIAGAGPSAAGAKKMAAGGYVPGRGNEDTVPALLTPGEYVIPKEQVAQLAARGVLRLNGGGMVPSNQSNEPPEARRQALTTQSGTGNVPGTGQPSGQPSSSSAQSSSPQIGGGSSLFSGLAQAAHTYGNSLANIGSGGPGSIDKLGTLGDEPIIGEMGITGGGGGGGLKSALGGIGSGLTQAAQAIASSVKPWQMQQSAIPDPSQLPKYQVPTLQPARVA